MPNRKIKESARTSKNLSKVSDFSERLFWRLITTADDFGRFMACADLVLAACFPLLIGRISINDIEEGLNDLSAHDLISLYCVGDRRYGYFVKWIEHQGAPRAEKSKYPDPTIEQLRAAACNGKHMCTDAPERPNTNTNTNTTLSLQNLRIVDSDSVDDTTTPMPYGFPAFWQRYPRKKSKGQAERVWAKLNPNEPLQDRIFQALERAKNSADWCKDGGVFIPYPATWLNARGWEDEVLPAGRTVARSMVDLMP